MVEVVGLRSIHHVNVAKIQSPPFSAHPPHIISRELIPRSMAAVMEPWWNKGAFEASEISVDKIFDVFVTAEGLVFSQDGKLILETVTQHSKSEQEEALARISTLTDVAEIRTSCLLLRKRGDDNYGHWLVELLPKLSLARSACEVSGLALPLVDGAMNTVIRDSLTLCGSAPALHFPIHKKQVHFFKELVLVTGATNHGVFMSPLVVQDLERMASSVRGSGAQKVFVSRKGARRDLVNADAVEAELASRGFSIIHPGEMTMEQQIVAFRNARLVVGVMGAGMTNIVFAQRGARVVNITPAAMPDTFFYFLSVHKQQSYCEVRGENIANPGSWDELFSVSFEAMITAMG